MGRYTMTHINFLWDFGSLVSFSGGAPTTTKGGRRGGWGFNSRNSRVLIVMFPFVGFFVVVVVYLPNHILYMGVACVQPCTLFYLVNNHMVFKKDKMLNIRQIKMKSKIFVAWKNWPLYRG
jgi:hypothetical protein